ncbi:hypothetical protein [Sphingobium sp. YG1]|uniref:hypothetical protein n=1 Tax=Sphingobium sp. YG1 TaxID=2082188 RepID=UPI0011AE4989|nr:hypothetical protein [Sphingobium sp. YG1]
MKNVREIFRAIAALDRLTAWAFPPWLPIFLSVAAFVSLLVLGDFAGSPERRSPLVGLGGAIMACLGIITIARPVIRAGGYRAWYEQSKIIDGGSFKPSTEEIVEIEEGRKDSLAVNIIGPALAISGTLINGASGFIAP